MAANWATSTRSLGDVLGQAHRHHEVDVGQQLGEGRGARDVGRRAPGGGPRSGGPRRTGSRGPCRTRCGRRRARAARCRRRGGAASSCAARRRAPRSTSSAGRRTRRPSTAAPAARAELARAVVLHVDAGAGEQAQRGVVDARGRRRGPRRSDRLGAQVVPSRRSSVRGGVRRRAGARRARRRPRRRRDSAGAAFAEELEPEAAEVAAGMGTREEVHGMRRRPRGAGSTRVTLPAAMSTIVSPTARAPSVPTVSCNAASRAGCGLIRPPPPGGVKASADREAEAAGDAASPAASGPCASGSGAGQVARAAGPLSRRPRGCTRRRGRRSRAGRRRPRCARPGRA